MSSLIPPTKIFFTVEWTTWPLRILSLYSSLRFHNSFIHLVGSCTHSGIHFFYSGVCNKPKAPRLFGVWISHYHTVRECSPLLIGQKWLCSCSCSLGDSDLDMTIGKWEPSAILPRLRVNRQLLVFFFFNFFFPLVCVKLGIHYYKQWTCTYSRYFSDFFLTDIYFVLFDYRMFLRLLRNPFVLFCLFLFFNRVSVSYSFSCPEHTESLNAEIKSVCNHTFLIFS